MHLTVLSMNQTKLPSALYLDMPASRPVTQGQAPEFLMPPQKTVTAAGEPARFIVRVAGTPTPRVDWSRVGFTTENIHQHH